MAIPPEASDHRGADDPRAGTAGAWPISWDAVGAIGGAVGGSGVLITLLSLAIQTRQNTRAVRAGTYSQLADSFSAISLALFLDPSAADLIHRAREDPDGLSPEELNGYGLFVLSYLRRAENMSFRSEEGTLDTQTWRGIRASIFSVLQTKSAQDSWRERNSQFNASFRRFVDEELEARSEGAPRRRSSSDQMSRPDSQ